MAKRRSKLTKLLDNLVEASKNLALKGNKPPEVWDDIDEDYALARFHLQHYVSSIEAKLKDAQRKTEPS